MDGVFICTYSSFDDLEVTKKAREFIYDLLNQYKNILYVAFQSRAEFVVDSILKEIKEKLPGKKSYVFIGLESSNDFITRYCIHKGYGFMEVSKKVKLLKKYGVHPGVFLLIKPPFMTEKESIDDAIKSIKDCFRIGVEDIYLMCNRIGGYSITDPLYKMKKYRAPWLWSIIEVLKNFDEEGLKRIKISGFRVAIATLDDPHNCKICNERVMNAIEKFNRTKSVSAFDKLDCECKKEWEEELKRRYLPLKTRIIEDYKELISFYGELKK
jgi:radical SAM enzyme (TIGR01210 family)